MTFIYIDTTAGNTAIIATDTWSYTLNARELGVTDKVHLFPERRLAVVTQGPVRLGVLWASTIAELDDRAGSVALLNAEAPELLRRVWEQVDEPYSEGLVLHAGWDDVDGRYTLTAFDSLHDFEPETIDRPFVHPTPLSYQFGTYEAARVSGIADKYRGPKEDREALQVNVAHALGDGYPIPSIRDDDNLVSFAEFVRDTRAKQPVSTGMKVLIGGALWRTVMTPDEIFTGRIHEFPDPAEVLADTEHPTAQHAPCACGSGQLWILCCGQKRLNQPCHCHSGRTFGDCCADLPAETPVGA